MDAASDVPRVLLLHNVPTPYRMPVFERLGSDVLLTVWFCGASNPKRRWRFVADSNRISTRVLRGRWIGGFLVNPDLPLQFLRHDADVVVVAEDLPIAASTAVIVALARIRRIPVVLWTEHVSRAGSSASARSAAYRAFRRLLLRATSVVLAMSGAASAQEIESLGWRGRTVLGAQVMPRGMMPERRPVAAGKVDGPLLFLGYLRPEKNVGLLIDAVLARPSLSLVVAGDGPERRQLEERAAGSARISFVGDVELDGKTELLAAASALVLPSAYEPWGLVVNEALHSGTPVLLSQRAGAAALITDGGNGLLFDPDLDGEIGTVVGRFAGDRDLRRALVDGARRTETGHLSDPAMSATRICEAVRIALH